MSGKFEKKESHKEKRRGKHSRIVWILPAVILAVFLASCFLPEDAGNGETTLPPAAEAENQSQTLPAETMPQEEYLLSIDGNIKIKEIGSYTGTYMEDGSDEPVENVMRILVKNIGEDPLQYAKIALTGENEDAVFEMTTLLPGESMIVLEANRKAYSAESEYTSVRAEHIAYFQYAPSNQEDTLWIQPLDGGFNIKNISEEDIDGKIVIYFKNYAQEQYVGGITYSGTIQSGLKAGEIKQIMSSHFSASDTKVVFITIG